MTDPRVWQALLAAELSAQRSLALARELGSSSDPWEALLQHPILTDAEKKKMRLVKQSAFEGAMKAGVQVLRRDDFPTAIGDFGPPAMFVWGDPSCLNAKCIGIVGTRAASAYGRAVALKFAEAFARAGATVVSGGALGIDAAAHKGALSVGGKTAAVVAGGIEQVYPAMHAGLFQQIRSSGCLVSQHAVGSRPSGFRFLSRNHLIAGLSRAIVVIEAPKRSGALSTVTAANDQGKEVFVVPANVDNLNFAGSHALIRDGATLVDHPNQVLETLNIAPAGDKKETLPVSEGGATILSALQDEPLTAEKLSEATGIAAAELMAELTMLELEGQIMRDGSRFVLRP